MADTTAAAPIPERPHHSWLFRVHRDGGRAIIRAGLASSGLVGVLMMMICFARYIVETVGVVPSMLIEWPEDGLMTALTVVVLFIGAVYTDLQIMQVLARAITDISLDAMDKYFSWIPIITFIDIIVLKLVGLMVMILPPFGWQEWSMLLFLFYRANSDVILGDWTYQRLTLRMAQVNEELRQAGILR